MKVNPEIKNYKNLAIIIKKGDMIQLNNIYSIFLITILLGINLIMVQPTQVPLNNVRNVDPDMDLNLNANDEDTKNLQYTHNQVGTRSDQRLVFIESSYGLPVDGDYNFIEFGDIDKDNNIDIAFGGGGWPIPSTLGMYVYTGDGGSSWTSKSEGLSTKNTWGGIELIDADSDGAIELYASDEPWGSTSNSGVKVWEFRDDKWTDSMLHVSTPVQYGAPNNVLLTDVTGSTRADMVVCKNVGLNYFQNNGGNPVTWQDRSEGLANTKEFTGVAVADINKDGLRDIIASDYSGNEYIYIQSSTGTLWSDYSSSLNSGGITYGVAVGDVNADTHMDLIFGTTGGGLLCWLGNSGGTDGTDFQWVNGSADLITSNVYNQIQLVDIDLDGDLDIIAPEGNNGKGMQIYLGNGNTDPGMDIHWTLARNTNLPENENWYGANCYDINNDGALDIVGASWGAGVRAWLNNINNNLNNDQEKFNLHITTDDITLSKENPSDGDEVTIFTKVTNLGVRVSSEFVIEFYVDDVQIEQKTISDPIVPDDDLELETHWVASKGTHKIMVEIIVDDEELESDITDNSAELSITVKDKDPNNNDSSDPNEILSGQMTIVMIFFIIIIIIILIILLTRRKKKNVKFIVEPLDEPD